VPVRCATCNKQFSTIRQVADHIGETYQGFQGEWRGSGDEKPTQKDINDFLDTSGGFAHLKYFKQNNFLVELDELYPTLMAGTRRSNCRARFTNNLRLYQHIIETGHGEEYGEVEYAKKSMKVIEEFEKKLF